MTAGFTAQTEPRKPARAAPLCSFVVRALEGTAVRLQYEVLNERQDLYRCLTFYLQIGTFWSGADGTRTHALRRAKAMKFVLVRPDASGDFDVLQVFWVILGLALSGASRSVPARLQYGCSNRPRSAVRLSR